MDVCMDGYLWNYVCVCRTQKNGCSGSIMLCYATYATTMKRITSP